MPIADTAQLADVQSLLARAKHIRESRHHLLDLIAPLKALEIACRELSMTINELAWARATMARSKQYVYPDRAKICMDDLEMYEIENIFTDAIEHPWCRT